MTAHATDSLDVVRSAFTEALVALGDAQDPCPAGLRYRLDRVVAELSNMRAQITGPVVQYRAYDAHGQIREVLTGRLIGVADNAHGDLMILMADGQIIERKTTDVRGDDLTSYSLERVS